jgi:hypothetical protein
MAKVIVNISYVISGLCFILLIAVGAGHVKFMGIHPGAVTVNVVELNSKNYAELILEKSHMCRILVDYPYSRINYIIENDRVMMPIETRSPTFIPMTIKYECRFLVFHKIGTEMVYAQVN